LADNLDQRRLVAARGELFRLFIPASRLDEMKARYREGVRLRSWLRAVGALRASVGVATSMTDVDSLLTLLATLISG
jgi:selenocysteine lyase/cysteine desulfurase